MEHVVITILPEQQIVSRETINRRAIARGVRPPETSATASCGAVLTCMFHLSVAIAALAIGIADRDDACQNDKAGLSLSTWLIVHGAVILGAVVLACMIASVGTCLGWTEERIQTTCGPPCARTAQILHFAWDVVGAVLLATSHDACVRDGRELGIVAVIVLVITGVSVLCQVVVCIVHVLK